MTIIVDQTLLAERFCADDEPLPAIGSEPGNGADDPAFVDDHRRKRRAVAIAPRADRGAAAEQGGRAGAEGAAVEQHRSTVAIRGPDESGIYCVVMVVVGVWLPALLRMMLLPSEVTLPLLICRPATVLLVTVLP